MLFEIIETRVVLTAATLAQISSKIPIVFVNYVPITKHANSVEPVPADLFSFVKIQPSA